MRSVVVTGLGFVTCLGQREEEITQRLREMSHGLTAYQPFIDDPKVPVSVAAPLRDFDTTSPDPEDWTYPDSLRFRLEQLKALSPNALYAHFALRDAFASAGLSEEDYQNPRTGLYTASSGSAMLTAHHLERLKKVGPLRCSPLGIVASIAGTLNFNLVSAFKFQGSSTGFVSACASSGHALGAAFDEIALGRQERMVVVGAEDFTHETILPFAGMRVLSLHEDPEQASRPFDQNRDGFVGTGGSVCMVLEEESVAKARGAPIFARFSGWGQSTDGYHLAIAHPEGLGIQRAMQHALKSAEWEPSDIDYLNAHATSTVQGDLAEARAIVSVFGDDQPNVSSTKALTGHALSLSSIMEAAFCVLAIKEGFQPGSANISTPDPAFARLKILRETLTQRPARIMSNSSGFGGANVSLLFEDLESRG